jgi:hypothetical protein
MKSQSLLPPSSAIPQPTSRQHLQTFWESLPLSTRKQRVYVRMRAILKWIFPLRTTHEYMGEGNKKKSKSIDSHENLSFIWFTSLRTLLLFFDSSPSHHLV